MLAFALVSCLISRPFPWIFFIFPFLYCINISVFFINFSHYSTPPPPPRGGAFKIVRKDVYYTLYLKFVRIVCVQLLAIRNVGVTRRMLDKITWRPWRRSRWHHDHPGFKLIATNEAVPSNGEVQQMKALDRWFEYQMQHVGLRVVFLYRYKYLKSPITCAAFTAVQIWCLSHNVIRLRRDQAPLIFFLQQFSTHLTPVSLVLI
jgi:hypothetical protein